MAAISAKLQDFITQSNLKEDVAKWLVTVGILGYEEVALLADDLAGVTPGFFAVMKAANVESMKEVIALVNCKKLWRLCKDQDELDRKVPGSSAEVTGEMPIPQADHQLITEAWTNRHNMVLPDSQLLIPTHQGKMWREANMAPPQVSTWLAQTLRTRACLNNTMGTQLAVIPGQSVEAVEIVADAIEKSFELWVRIRAFFMTLAFVSIKNPKWFPLQSAMTASDLILQKIMATYKGRTAPLQFLITAWAETTHWLSEQVRMGASETPRRTPASIMDNAGAWETRWAWNPSSGSDTSAGGGAVQQADDRVMKTQLANMNKQVSMYKQQAIAAKQFANMQKQVTMSRQARRDESAAYEDDEAYRGNNNRGGGGKGNRAGGGGGGNRGNGGGGGNRGGGGSSGGGAPQQGNGGGDGGGKRPRKRRGAGGR